MYVFELSLKIGPKVCTETIADDFDAVLVALYQNGQIAQKWTTTIQQGIIRAWVRTYEKTSLLKKHCCLYFTDHNRKLEQMAGTKIQKKCIGTALGHIDACSCKTSAFLFLHTAYLCSEDSPVYCGNCCRCVPLYRLPHLFDSQYHYPILSWQWQSLACDDLYIGSSFGETWAARQMSDPNSGLSKQGREICGELEQVIGTPVFYYLNNYRKTSFAEDRKRLCPVCEKKFFRHDDRKAFWFDQFRCDSCRLLSSLSVNSQ